MVSRLNQLAKKVIAAWSLNPPPDPTALSLATISFLLPLQLSRHFWPDFSYVAGLRSDYLAPTIYLTDIVIVWLLLTLAIKGGLHWLVTRRLDLPLSAEQRSYLYLLIGIIVLSALSLYGSVNPAAGWWHLGKLLEFGLLGLLISFYFWQATARKLILGGFLAGISVQAFLALAQFLLDHSVGLWFLGERTFNLDTPGIARAVIDGQLVLRSYGTFPHPNVLAFFLLVGSQLAFWLALREKSYWLKLTLAVVTSASSLAILTTLSRVAILLWLIGAALIFIMIRPRFTWLGQLSSRTLAAVAIALGLVFLAPPLISRFDSVFNVDQETVTQRLELNDEAIKIISNAPLHGVGLSNFVNHLEGLPEVSATAFYQPAHNLYLLVASEVGIIGLVFLLVLLGLGFYRSVESRTWLAVLIVSEVAIAGLFDHYFWDLQQGGLIFWSIAGGLFSPMVGHGVTRDRRPAPRS